MLENIIEQTDLITPTDAIELSMNDLEEVNGAGGFGGGSCGLGGFAFNGLGSCGGSCESCGWGGGSCLTAVDLTVSFNECLKFVTFGGWGSCGSCEWN